MVNVRLMIYAGIITAGLFYLKEQERLNDQNKQTVYYSNHNNKSEDILVKKPSSTRYYLNQDGDSTIDRIVFFNNDSQIENILLRQKDYIENKNTFDLADKVLEQEREKRKRNKNNYNNYL